ncbi:MAG: DNA repair protein RecO [Clostridia bacterium]|nr:DNA repair protein RecO [Clostridia bacterium]
MQIFTDDGLVLKAGVTGEADMILHVLTRSHGIIRTFAKGARGAKSRLHAVSTPFSFADFTFSEKNGVYNVREAQIKTIFFRLREDMALLALGQYFCEVLLRSLPEDTESDEYLRLTLNTLHFLCEGTLPPLLLKAIFELRIASVSGYMPQLVACDTCGEYRTEEMYFDALSGKLYCSACGRGMPIPKVPYSVIETMRNVVFAPFGKIFSVSPPPEELPSLNRLTETFLQNSFQINYRLLSFFYAFADDHPDRVPDAMSEPAGDTK